AVVEDGITEKVATFAEGNGPAFRVVDQPEAEASANPATSLTSGASFGGSPPTLSSLVAGANVFVLFDTSNYMYRGFVFAQDAIAEFVRSLHDPARVAFYSYSRNFSRASLLTPERSEVIRAIRASVAGDDAALYNSLLMTLRDAARLSGRKVVVVFSNGPDNASAVGPEDVRE